MVGVKLIKNILKSDKSASMTISALKYHDLTSYDRQKMGGHYLDWENQPSLYKKYPGIDPLPLPEVTFGPGKRFLSLLRDSRNDTHQHICRDVFIAVLPEILNGQ